MQKLNIGFSLLEIMVVIAIIAIIATLAIPSQTGAITQRRVIESIELVEPYKANIEAYYHLHAGEFPKNNKEARLPESDKILGNYIEKMEVREGVMHLYFGQKMPEKLKHKILSIRPVFVKDSPNSRISWICGMNTIPNGMTAAGTNLTDFEILFLPGRCR
jgi:type IV pilus assembly protein PilA